MTKTLWAGPQLSLRECGASVSALEFLLILPSAVYTRAMLLVLIMTLLEFKISSEMCTYLWFD